MKKNKFLYASTFLFILNVLHSLTAQTGPYFGQPTPGIIPKPFAPGIIYTKGVHSTPSFSPDGLEMIWAEMESDWSNSNIYFLTMIDSQWTVPEITSFCSNYIDDVPIYSPDGQKIYFTSERQ